MGMTNLRHSLEKRYSALTGQLREAHDNIARIKREAEKLSEIEASIPRLEALIASAAMLLEDADPSWQREQTPAIKPWTHSLPVPFGSCGRRGMEVLRQADRPMTPRQIALEVLRQAGNESADGKTVQRTLNAIEASMRKHRGRTVESSGKYPAQWRSIANPSINFDV
jgi:hypothetical protein